MSTSRRQFIVGAGASVASLGALRCSGGCSAAKRPGGSFTNAAQSAALVPAYEPIELVKPDFPAEGPLPAGFLKYPQQEFVQVIHEKPGRGGPEITSMTAHWGPTPPGLGRNAFVAAVNDALGVTVNPSCQDGMTFGNKLSAILGARDVPDLLSVPSWEVDNIPRFSQAVKALFADLSPHLQGDAVKNYPMLATLPTSAWRNCVWGERLAAVPFPTNGPFPWALFYRKDLLDQLDVELPKNIEEFHRLGKELTRPEKGVWAFSDVSDMVEMYFRCPHAQGGWRKKPGGGLEFKYETEEYREAVAFSARLFKDGLVHPDLVASKGGDSKQLFMSGRVLMLQDGMGAWQPMQSEQQKVTQGFNMQPLPVFAADGGTPLTWGGGTTPIFYTFVKDGLSKERTEELLRVLNWCAAPFGSKENLLAENGVEGKHFTRGADNAPMRTELGREEIATQFALLGGRAPVSVGGGDTPNYLPDLLAYSRDAVKYLGENPFEGIKIELPPTYSKTITTTQDKIRDLVRGRRPLSDLDEIVEEWRRMGGDAGRDFLEKALAANGR